MTDTKEQKDRKDQRNFDDQTDHQTDQKADPKDSVNPQDQADLTAEMAVNKLALNDFRSWQQLVVDFSHNVNVLVGKNGIGKTNIVEALEFLSVGSSHRASASRWLVRRGSAHAIIRANAAISTSALPTALASNDSTRDARLNVTIPQRGAIRARINDDRSSYFGDIAGLLKVVLFSPNDEQLVSGAPSLRREFLNQTCTLMDPGYYPILQRFRQTARQRAAVLKRLQEGFDTADNRQSALAELEAWTAQFTALGIAITRARQKAIAALAPLVTSIYADLSGSHDEQDTVYLVYQPSFDEVIATQTASETPHTLELTLDARKTQNDTEQSEDSQTMTQMAQLRSAIAAHFQRLYAGEVARGASLIGPQRDDCDFLLGGAPARQTASNGEMWTMALALRMAQYRWLAARGPKPVLVLDDVFSQLDEHRRAQILDFARGCGQVFITVAARSDIPRGFLSPSDDLPSVAVDVDVTRENEADEDVADEDAVGAIRLIDVEKLAADQSDMFGTDGRNGSESDPDVKRPGMTEAHDD